MPENIEKSEEEKKNDESKEINSTEILQVKNIDDYDKEITQAVKKLHPEIFEAKYIEEEEKKENLEILEEEEFDKE